MSDAIALRVDLGVDGRPRRATAEARVAATASHAFAVISDVRAYAGRVPMIHRVRVDGDRVTIYLKFRLALFSVGFEFVATRSADPTRRFELAWISGEPRGIVLRFDIEPLTDESACIIRSTAEFDVRSLGWLAKYFLRHHPEIEFGVMPGVTLVLLDSMRRAAENASTMD